MKYFNLPNTNLINFYLPIAQILYCLLISFIINLLTLITSLYSMQVFDRVLASSSVETLLYLTIITFVCIMLCLKLSYYRYKILNYLVNNKNKKILSTILNYKQPNCVLEFTKDDYDNLGIIKQFIVSTQFCSIFDMVFVFLFLIAIFLINWFNAIICVIFILVILLSGFIQYAINKNLTLKNKKNDTFFAKIENIERLSHLANARFNFLKNWQKNNSKNEFLRNIQADSTNLFLIFNKNLKLFFQILLTAICAFLVLKNQMTVGGIIATSILVNKALSPFDNFIWFLNYYPKFNYSLSKIIEKYTFSKNYNYIDCGIINGNLQVRNLIFKDKNNKFIFKDLSFDLNAGESLVIVGDHNCGKTLLMKLILKIQKIQYGSIKIDGIDIENINYFSYNRIGYLAENFEYFDIDLKLNITQFDNDICDQRIIEIITLCDCLELINHQSKNFEHYFLLSRSNQQKIALASALIANIKILILDNPSSYLNNNSSHNILINVIKYCKKHNITLIVTSNLKKIIKECDYTLCLENTLENASYKFIKNHH